MNPKVQILDNGFLSIVDAVLCPQCVHDGTTSVVHTSRGVANHAAVDMFHDSFGNFHSHDPNETTSDWSCSLGHRGKAYSRRACQNSSCKIWNGYLEYVADPSKYSSKERASSDAVEESGRARVADVRPRDTNITPSFSSNFGTYYVSGNTVEPLSDPPLTLVGTVSYGGHTYQGVFHIQKQKI